MKIAQIAPIVERIPPKTYGGTERVIHALVEGLVERGHDVTLFASGDSITSAKLAAAVPRSLRQLREKKDMYGFNISSMLNMGAAYAAHNTFDIIHDHNPLVALPTAHVIETPVVMTWHGPYDADMNGYFQRFSKPHLIAISRSQAALAPALPFAGVVYNGLSMERYPFSPSHKGYLVFVGRIDAQKGVHHAMDAAIELRIPLIIAAKLDDTVPHIRRYFEREIEPRLRAHPKLLSWIGEVDEAERNAILKDAMCLLHAVTWPEPFGLTLIEAAACGCPVVAFNRGAIPEIVRDGMTGFVVDDLQGMVEAVKRVDTISRAACRAHALERFSAQRMVSGYEAIYRRILESEGVQSITAGGSRALPRGILMKNALERAASE